MLLSPALIALLAAGLGLFSIGLGKISLETQAFEIARSTAIGLDAEISSDLDVNTSQRGRLSCVHIERSGLWPVKTEHCMIRYGG